MSFVLSLDPLAVGDGLLTVRLPVGQAKHPENFKGV